MSDGRERVLRGRGFLACTGLLVAVGRHDVRVLQQQAAQRRRPRLARADEQQVGQRPRRARA
eukprot:6429206-Prymnesium_polylepis.2